MQHGVDCPKAQHNGAGLLHASTDDSPYYVDGVAYCGRCHTALVPDSRTHTLMGSAARRRAHQLVGQQTPKKTGSRPRGESKLPDIPNPWGLSRSEQAVCCGLVEGFSQIEIGKRMFLNNKTVCTYVDRSKMKMNALNTAHVAVLWDRFARSLPGAEAAALAPANVQATQAALERAQVALHDATIALLELTPQTALAKLGVAAEGIK